MANDYKFLKPAYAYCNYQKFISDLYKEFLPFSDKLLRYRLQNSGFEPLDVYHEWVFGKLLFNWKTQIRLYEIHKENRPGGLKAYLGTCLINTCRKQVKKWDQKGRDMCWVVGEISVEGFGRTYNEGERSLFNEDLCSVLTKKQGEVLSLRHKGYKYREIAEMTGKTEGNAKKLARAGIVNLEGWLGVRKN